MPSTVECSAVLTMPPPLRPGDLIAVVAPSSPFPLREMWGGLAWLRQRYRLTMSTGALSRDAYLAGSDARRARASSVSVPIRAIRAARAIVAATVRQQDNGATEHVEVDDSGGAELLSEVHDRMDRRPQLTI